MPNVSKNNMVALSDLDDYTVAEGEPDVRGWSVISEEGVRAGTVKELIIDKAAMKVRYLDVSLNKSLFDRTVDRRILLPVGMATLDRDDKRVLLDETPISSILRVPPYAPGPIYRDYEVSIRTALGPDTAEPVQAEADFYEHPHFNERRFYEGQAASQESERI